MYQDFYPGSCAGSNLANQPIEHRFHPGWTITKRDHQPIELSDHTHAKIVVTTRPTPLQTKAFALLALNPACTQ